MPTTALPAGTRNTSLNLIDEEYQLVIGQTGRAGAFYKEWALKGLKAAAQAGDEAAKVLANQIEGIRNERLRLKHGIIVLLAGLCVVAAPFMNQVNARRQRTSSTRVVLVKAKSGRKETGSELDTFTPDPMDNYGPVDWASITTYATPTHAQSKVNA